MGYDRKKAVEYAHKWAYKRNPAYYNFDEIGGDCTNFVSQAIYSGCGIMNFTPIYGWYYRNANNKSASWTGVEFLYNFLINNRSVGPYAVKTAPEYIDIGDVIQLSFDGQKFSHSMLVVEKGNNLKVAAHLNDIDYNPVSNYVYKDIRYIHIVGVRY